MTEYDERLRRMSIAFLWVVALGGVLVALDGRALPWAGSAFLFVYLLWFFTFIGVKW